MGCPEGPDPPGGAHNGNQGGSIAGFVCFGIWLCIFFLPRFA